VEAELAPVFRLEEDPVLVPAGQKIRREGLDRSQAEILR
jgi:hypothetical protein